MATKKITKKRFSVGAKCWMETDVEILADTMEEALEQARALNVLDFVTPAGNHNDSSFIINSVFSHDD